MSMLSLWVRELDHPIGYVSHRQSVAKLFTAGEGGIGVYLQHKLDFCLVIPLNW